ncbi:MAG: alanine--glyoxylate aminotransferase family protein [Nitrososphaerota archaeon]|nr:alanine--glyoxylate aminotransferase family protein [Candidatus Bathyarchaeota archaeon]MDW8023528.1 alanine--glyoxylate aminotransferase family protein [Nitrososphaerota archaeon]
MFDRRLIMLPGPTNVPERISHAMIQPMINHRGADFHKLYSEIEANLKYTFQTESDVFVLSASGTGGVECAVSNVVDRGDKVIVPVFGVFSKRLAETVKRRGGIPVELNLPLGTAPKSSLIKEFTEKESNAKAILIVYNETSTGVKVCELPEIAKIAEENNMLIVVDAVSALGGDELPVDEWGIDVCVAGSQKCLACPPGLSVISVSQKAWEKIEKTESKPMYYDLTLMREHAAKKETPFTPAIPLLYALNEALKMLKEEGLERSIERHKKCAEAFYNAIEAFGLSIFPKDMGTRSNTVIAVNAPEKVDESLMRNIMRDKYKVVIGGGMGELKGKIFRIGSMGKVALAEVVMTLSALGNALMDLGYNLDIEAGLAAAVKAFDQCKT